MESAACVSSPVPRGRLCFELAWDVCFIKNSSLTFLSLSLSLSDFDCLEPLGIESGEIPSEQIEASSEYNPNWAAQRSRLNNFENGWTPMEDSNKEWIQVAQDNHLYINQTSCFDEVKLKAFHLEKNVCQCLLCSTISGRLSTFKSSVFEVVLC